MLRGSQQSPLFGPQRCDLEAWRPGSLLESWPACRGCGSQPSNSAGREALPGLSKARSQRRDGACPASPWRAEFPPDSLALRSDSSASAHTGPGPSLGTISSFSFPLSSFWKELSALKSPLRKDRMGFLFGEVSGRSL